MDTSVKSLPELVQELPPPAQRVVRSFVEFLLMKHAPKAGRKLRQDWAGALRDYRDQYTEEETEASLVDDWLAASMPSLREVWDNEEDALLEAHPRLTREAIQAALALLGENSIVTKFIPRVSTNKVVPEFSPDYTFCVESISKANGGATR